MSDIPDDPKHDEFTSIPPSADGFSALRSGTRLDNRYIVDAVIAAGGFGITYLVRHEGLDRMCAIKEHFPRRFAYRDGATLSIRPLERETFMWALDRFIKEGQSLARCKHPGVANVVDVFEGNGTAYMVLDYEDGQSLKSWLDELGRPPTQAEIDGWLNPLLDALAHVHSKGILHRDIAPDNIMIRRDGSPCLIDFGSARQALAQRSQFLSAIVKSGYSPPEQYTTAGRSQGPWSDVYALAGTLYRVLTGKVPQEAPSRQLIDDLQPLARTIADPGAYRAGFLAAIDHGLVLRPEDRPQSVEVWKKQLAQVEAPRPVASAVTAPAARRGQPEAKAPTAYPPTPVSIAAPQSHPNHAGAAAQPVRGNFANWARPLAAGFGLVAVLGGIAALGWTTRSGSELSSVARAEAVTRIASATTAPELDSIERLLPQMKPDIERRRGEIKAAEAAETRRIALLAAEADAKLREAEARRRDAEAERQKVEASRQAALAEARRKAEVEARLQAEELRRKQAETEARLKAETEARLQAEEARRKLADAEARLKSETEARLKAEEIARRASQAREAAERDAASRPGDARTAATAPAASPTPPATATSANAPAAPDSGQASQSQAAPPAAATQPEAPVNLAVLTRDLQQELHRVGCLALAPDGQWGPLSQRGLSEYARLAGKVVPLTAPTTAALTAVRLEKARVCPLICNANQIEQNGACVANPAIARAAAAVAIAKPTPPKPAPEKPSAEPRKTYASPPEREKPQAAPRKAESNSGSGNSNGGRKWHPAGTSFKDKSGRTCTWYWNQGRICN